MIVVGPCPGIGQETLSPLRATPIPPKIMVSEQVITEPPCVVLSPFRIICNIFIPLLGFIFHITC